MRVLLVGAGGTIGRAVAERLRRRGHEVLGLSRSTDPPADLADVASLPAALAAASSKGPLDAVVSTGPSTPLRALADLIPPTLAHDVAAKLFGQLELLRLAAGPSSAGGVGDRGTVILTGGQAPDMPGGAAGSMVNSALEAFARVAHHDLPRGIRVHVVAPGWITESLPSDADTTGSMTAEAVADTYAAILEAPTEDALTALN